MFRQLFFLTQKCRSITFVHKYKFSTQFNARIDYFKVLGISRQATQQQTKNAFLQKAKEYHPDVNPQNEEKFKLINEAYKVLSNSNTKRQYERLSEVYENENPVSSNPTSGSQELKQKDPFKQYIQTYLKHREAKRKQRFNMHISPQYVQKKSRTNQNMGESKEINKVKFLIGVSGFLTAIMLIEVGLKYRKYKLQNKI